MPCSHLPPADAPDALRVDDAHLTETVLLLARGIAADLGFDRLPILADALEDAGCDNFALLNHLRHEPEHRVECWALRRLLRTTLMLPGGVPMVFAYCPPGTFLMGDDSSNSHENERPVRRVTLTKGFHVGIYPVTQAQWLTVMGADVNRILSRDWPIVDIRWSEARAFCERVNRVLATSLRLPTEAEWEYACRAGSRTLYHFGDVVTPGAMNHGFGESTDGEIGRDTTRVGRFPANAWGLCDMHGNVLEWCEDWYYGGFYRLGPSVDPLCTDAKITRERVCRGGSWVCRPNACRAASRFAFPPDTYDLDRGFRVVFTA